MKVFGIAGWSGSGKTTLLEKLIPALIARGLKVSVIKHAHHGFDIDKPGKDSYSHRAAGAAEVMLACGTRWALMHECRDEPEPQLAELLARLAPCDLVLVEGFKQEPVPKLEVHRPAHGKSPLFAERDDIVAVASDAAIAAPIPVLPLNDIAAVAEFIIGHCQLKV
ncbi:molybdopterin-guanine dinucleotide biosynthesis protein B [Azonexus sp.]|uniref:molybdopterin-guanine dinucleotide biosynthesis protein B n=1 Tax=Azonexus sp. TaxID=1872668 RepID=UPI0035B3D737